MEHREATDAVMRLIPTIGDGDPGDALVSYAARRRLAPAQLHKMAQVFNTCSTLYGQTVDRTRAPELVDGQALVDRYVSQTGKSSLKAAASFMVESAPAPVMEKAASAPDGPAEVPLVWGEEPYKRAADEPELDPRIKRDRFFREFDRRVRSAVEGVDKIASGLGEFNDNMDSMVRGLKGLIANGHGENVLARMERDARGFMDTPLAKAAFDMIAGCARRAGVKTVRFEDARISDSILATDTTGMMDRINGVMNGFSKAASAIAGFEDDVAACLKMAGEVPEDGLKRANRLLDTLRRGTAAVDGYFKIALAEEAPEKKPGRSSGPKAQALVRTQGRLKNLERLTDDEEPSYRSPAEDAAAAVGHTIALPLDFLSDVAEDTGQALAAPGRFLHDLASPKGELASLLDPYSRDYQQKARREQADLDTHEMDVIALANVKRLMATDEVISEADPADVAEAFNAIRQSGPEVATNISLLRLQLRQALQTQGYDIDSATAARKFDKGRTESTRERNEA